MLAGLRRVVVILTRLFQTKIQCCIRHLASRDLAIMAALVLQSLLHMLKNGFLPPLLEANEHLVPASSTIGTERASMSKVLYCTVEPLETQVPSWEAGRRPLRLAAVDRKRKSD